MTIVAIIPARGGSKGLPGKNIRPLAGKPLLAHSIEQAQAAGISAVYVSTDSPEIAAVARSYGAEVIERPEAISGDEASSESALLHGLEVIEQRRGLPEFVLFLQCTSPLRRPADIVGALELLRTRNADSLASVAPSHRFLWRDSPDGPQSINWDFRNRPRRQDREPEYWENGSIYLFKPWVLRDLGNRLGGVIALYPMDERRSVDIDDAFDFALCEWLIAQ